MLASYTYDSLGRRTGVTYGNGTSRTYAYDPLSRLEGLKTDLASTASDQLTGRVAGVGTAIAYNPASQLASATRGNDSYAWSQHSNADRTYTANGLNQYSAVAGGSLTYDTRGNLTAWNGTTYAYNGLNQLTSVSGIFNGSLAYDPANRLYQLISGASTTRFQYAGASLMAEFDGANAMLRRYVHGAGTDEPLVWYEGPGTTSRRFLQGDERGSVVAVSDSTGASLAINRYDEYGIPQTSNLGRFSYTGQTALPEIGLMYYKARMYSPGLGRFMQTDPIGYGDGLNWYNYVDGDPVNFVDPTGLDDTGDVPVITITGSRRSNGWLLAYLLRRQSGGSGGSASGGGRGGSGSGQPAVTPLPPPPCPAPSPAAMQEITSAALDETASGGATAQFTTGFSTLSRLPDVRSSGWYSASNSHGGRTKSYQYDLGTSGYAVKVYFNDGHHSGLNTVAIVDADSIGHAVDAASVLLGLDNDDSRNFSLGVGYLKSIGDCGGQ